MAFRNIVMPFEGSANPIEDNSTNQIPTRGKFSEIEFGAGVKTFKGDERGIWLGSDDFDTAPFSVDMEGNITVNVSSTSLISSLRWKKDGKTKIFIGIRNV